MQKSYKNLAGSHDIKNVFQPGKMYRRHRFFKKTKTKKKTILTENKPNPSFAPFLQPVEHFFCISKPVLCLMNKAINIEPTL